MERRSFSRFPIVAAMAIVLLALAVFPAARAMAQDDTVVSISELNGSGISGDASLTDNGDGTTTVDILVDGATGGHPAMIHSGSCAELGSVVYPLQDVDATGESLTVVDATLESLLTAGPYAINIHLSADDPGTSVACGDIGQVAATGAAAAAASTATATPAATAGAVGGTSSVTDIGTSGVGTTFGGGTSALVLALMVAACFAFAGALGLRRREQRG